MSSRNEDPYENQIGVGGEWHNRKVVPEEKYNCYEM